MCSVRWLKIHALILWTATFLSSHISGTTVGGCSNSSSCSNSTLFTACDCSYYSSGIVCTASPVDNSKNRVIPYQSMTATSSYDALHAARDARLGNNTSAWCASNSTLDQYLQINLGRVFELWRIATQGLHTTNISGYVTAYKMTYSLDARIWNTYKESNNSLHKNFTGNRNTFNTSCNNLNNSYTTPLVARFVRIYPVTWVVHMCMRIELLGVPYNVNTSCSSTVCLCADGFHGDGRNCTDIDECKTQVNNTCHSNATCINTQGSYTCVCKHGYHGNVTNCTDINECAADTHSCSHHAQCINTIGSYGCRCKLGYYGNGRTCLDVDECSKHLHHCHDNASCSNTQGAYTCSCHSGYNGDGQNCTDIDECRWLTRVCPQHAVCNNIPGAFYCTCSMGYSGDNCTDVDVAGSTTDNYLGIAIGLPVIAVLLILFIIGALLFTRYRRMHVIRRPKSPKQPGSRPSSTVIGQIDKLFDDERKLRDSVSLRSLQFSIPSVHPSLTALNNIGLSTKGSPYETLQA